MQNSSIKIETLEISLNTKNSKPVIIAEMPLEFFSLNLWKFLIGAKNIENIEIKLPQIKDFFNHLQFIPKRTKEEESNEKDEYLFSQIYRL